MTRSFELFVASRYLRAKRREAAVSVITAISVAGVAAGVAALIIGLAVTNGFRKTLQHNLLGATSHVSILEKEPSAGISDWREISARLLKLPHVTGAAPSLYGPVLFSGPLQAAPGLVKGVEASSASRQVEMLRNLKEGSLKLGATTGGYVGIVMGSRLAQTTGMRLGSIVSIVTPPNDLTPMGLRMNRIQYRVTGIFESGFAELDSNWAFLALASAQALLSVGDVVNSIELTVDDIDLAQKVAQSADAIIGPKLAATHWKEQNKSLLNALQMEQAVTVITISLIQLVAALNILIALIMMVMEKHRDIAILMSMGARRQQIRNIFVLQGVLIGLIGTAAGLALGYSFCYFADHYRWIRLDAEVYSMSYVPFMPQPIDGLWISAVALTISFLATLYPARSATRITPVEALRYE